jgi:hypothetical protein
MALTPEEELELAQLEKDQALILGEIDSLKKEFTPVEEKTPPGNMESFLRSAAQGLTFESADELTAAAESALTNKPYQQALEESRAAYKAAEENTGASIAGSLTGGLGQGIALTALTGGAGAPAAVAGTASKLSKLGQLAKSALMPTTKAGALKNIASAAKVGAVTGGLTGLGRSEEKGIEALKDVPKSAITGGVVGGALGGIFEGGKKVGGGLYKRLKKAADEGKLEPSLKYPFVAIETGAEGKGFTSQESKERIVDNAMSLAEGTVRPKIQEVMNDLREVREYIISNSEGTLDISLPVESALNSLKKHTDQQSIDMSNFIESGFSNLKEKGFTTLLDAYNFAKNLKSKTYSNRELDARIQKIAYTLEEDIKNMVKDRIPQEKAVQVLMENPQMLSKFKKYVTDISEKDMAELVSNNKVVRDPVEAINRAKEVKAILQSFKGFGEDADSVLDIISDPQRSELLTKVFRQFNPITALNSKMNKLLEASQILGDVTGAKGDAEILEDVLKIFTNIINQPKDSVSARISRKKFESALELLKEVSPELSEEIETKIIPVIKELDIKRFAEGSGYEQLGKQSSILNAVLGDATRLATTGLNLGAQTVAAARKGVAGPIPFTTTILKPEVRLLKELKDRIDLDIARGADSIVNKMYSDALESAINQQDEVRRAAIIKTLMSYPTFREIQKKFEYKKTNNSEGE